MADTKSQDMLPRWLRLEDDRLLLNSEKTAAFFGVSTRTLINWESRGCPKEDVGWWDIKAIVEWRLDAEDSNEARKTKAEADLKEEQAQRARIENEVRAGRLIATDEVHSEWARRVSELKSSLLSLGRKISGRFTDPEVRVEVDTAINQEVYDFLNQYSRQGEYTPTGKPPKKKGKKMSKKGTG